MPIRTTESVLFGMPSMQGDLSKRVPDPFGARVDADHATDSKPAFMSAFIRDFYDAAVPYVLLMADPLYKNNAFFTNDSVVNDWNRLIHGKGRTDTGWNDEAHTGRVRNGLEGTIAGESYAERTCRVAERPMYPATIPGETKTGSQAYAPVAGKLRPFDAIKEFVDCEQLKRTEEMVGRFMDSTTS